MRLAHASVPAEQLEGFAAALAGGGARATGSLLLLRLLLGTWPATVQAAAADTSLLALVDWPTPEVAAFCEQLRAAAAGQEHLLLLAKATVSYDDCRVSVRLAQGSLQLLTTLLGSLQAAVEAAAADSRLLQLSWNDAQYDDDLQAVFARLASAGQSQKDLLRLATICSDNVDEVDRLTWMADELYGGDWRAAMLEFLRRWRVYVLSLCNLRDVLDTLASAGLEAANDTGRLRVLQLIKVWLPGAVRLGRAGSLLSCAHL